MKDQSMYQSKSVSSSFVVKVSTLLILLIVAALLSLRTASATTITQDFTTNPLQQGWQVFGDTTLFNWNSNSHNLAVTWDSSKSNSYFYHPLNTIITRHDDFSLAFDLQINSIVSNYEPGKTGGLEIGIGLFNMAVASSTNFQRGVFGGAPGIAEFDYFPSGTATFGDTVYEIAATTTPTFIATNSYSYAPTIYIPFIFDLPTNLTLRINMAYTASNQTFSTLLTTNGVTFKQFPDVSLLDTNSSGFGDGDDFALDTFSVSSYSSAGDDYDSVYGHGVVDNITITFPQPVVGFSGGFTSTNHLLWQGQFTSLTNWNYTLERTADLNSWTDVSATTSGNGVMLTLQDTNSPLSKAFYRIKAVRQ